MPSTAPLVSIIIRTVGRPELDRALASVGRQTYSATETLVVQARPGLPPPTNAADLRVLPASQPLPRADAANAGLAAATGDFAIFLDEDDEWDAAHIAGLVAVSDAGSAVYCDTRVVDAHGAQRALIGGPYRPLRLYAAGIFCVHACLFPLSPLRRAGIRFDPALPMYEDWDFWIALEPHVEYRYVDQCTAIYHAETGESGAGVGANRGGAVVVGGRRAIFDKWRDRIAQRGGNTDELVGVGRELAQKRLWVDAAGVLNAVLAREPGHAEALALAGTAALNAGDASRAVGLLERALATGEQAAIHYNLALAHDAGGDPDSANRHAQRALALSPDSAPLQKLVARYRTR